MAYIIAVYLSCKNMKYIKTRGHLASSVCINTDTFRRVPSGNIVAHNLLYTEEGTPQNTSVQIKALDLRCIPFFVVIFEDIILGQNPKVMNEYGVRLGLNYNWLSCKNNTMSNIKCQTIPSVHMGTSPATTC